jgi:hypothetical protein
MSAVDITVAPAGRLAELELVVARGVQTFIEVGAALAEIRSDRLYRVEHATFEAYCTTRWGFTASRARQLIAAAAVAVKVATVTRVTLPSERHARELGPLVRAQGTEAAGRALEEMNDRGQTTAADVREAVTAAVTAAVTSPISPPTDVWKSVASAASSIETIEIPLQSWNALQEAAKKLERLCSKAMAARALDRLGKSKKRLSPEARKIPAPVQDAVQLVVQAVENAAAMAGGVA